MCTAAIAGVVVSAVGTAASVYQGIQNMNRTVDMARQQQDRS